MQNHDTPPQRSIRSALLFPGLVLGLFLGTIYGPALAAAEGAQQAQDGTAQQRGCKQRGDRFNPEMMKARADARFKEVDVNGDDKITLNELQAARKPKAGHKRGRRAHPGMAQMRGKGHGPNSEDRAELRNKLYDALDADSDGSLSKTEFAEMESIKKSLFKQHMFTRMDKNEDGVLTRDEFPPSHQQRRHKQKGSGNNQE